MIFEIKNFFSQNGKFFIKDKDFQREDYFRCSYIRESLYFSVVQFTKL